jgi:FkbM family methyltransferase
LANDETEAVMWRRILDIEMGELGPKRAGGAAGESSLAATQHMQDAFFRILEAERANAFLEIGALWAEASRRFAALESTSGQAIAVEAHPLTFQRATERYDFASLGVTYIHSAVGAGGPTVEISVPVRDGTEGISMASMREVRSQSTSMNVYTVPCMTLEAVGRLVLTESRTLRAGLWVDVEGASLEVLRSGPKLLEFVRALYVEVEDATVWKDSTTSVDVLRYLLHHDFIPVARDHEHPHVWNMLLVKRSTYLQHMNLITGLLAERRRVLVELQSHEGLDLP